MFPVDERHQGGFLPVGNVDNPVDLREQIERQAQQAVFPSHRRIWLLTRAAFYLLWQGGLASPKSLAC